MMLGGDSACGFCSARSLAERMECGQLAGAFGAPRSVRKRQQAPRTPYAARDSIRFLQLCGQCFDRWMLVNIEHRDMFKTRPLSQLRNHSSGQKRVPSKVQEKIVLNRNRHRRE